MTMADVKELRKRQELNETQAAIVAGLRSIIERVIAGEIGGVCAIICDTEGQVLEDDLWGDVLEDSLHKTCHSIMLYIAYGPPPETE